MARVKKKEEKKERNQKLKRDGEKICLYGECAQLCDILVVSYLDTSLRESDMYPLEPEAFEGNTENSGSFEESPERFRPLKGHERRRRPSPQKQDGVKIRSIFLVAK